MGRGRGLGWLLWVAAFAFVTCSTEPTAETTDISTQDSNTSSDTAPDQDTTAQPDGGQVDTTVAADTASSMDTSADAPDAVVELTLENAVFKATHNSYSGGERRSILEQLDGGVRFIEFDVHDNDFDTQGDYGIGHNAPDEEVDHTGGNPASALLGDWLEQIASWSAAHPTAAPITVLIDVKDNLTDNPSFAAGNLAALNAILEARLGSHLLPASDVDPQNLPAFDDVRGRVLVVLSGDERTRRFYRRDTGQNPAVAMNAAGQVIALHEGTLARWYWTGERLADGSIQWHRHGSLDAGQDAALAINDDGWIVEVHSSTPPGFIYTQVGRMDADFEVTWQDAVQYDTGRQPTLVFTTPTGLDLHEIHLSPLTGQAWEHTGSLDITTAAVTWSPSAMTSAPLYPRQEATSGAASVQVRTGQDGSTPDDALLYETESVAQARIQYSQLMFVELQFSDAGELPGDDTLIFRGAAAGFAGLIKPWIADGQLVRLWGFNDPDQVPEKPVTHPATDTPFATWYLDYCAEVGCVE